MGMIQTLLRSCKPENDLNEFKRSLDAKAAQLLRDGDSDGERPEGVEIKCVTPENFDEHWHDQENIQKEDDIREQYFEKAKAGRLFAIEIDW